MKRLWMIVPLMGAALMAGEPGTPKLTRTALAAMENSIDQRIERASVDVPFDLLGTTRGVYLRGFGAVFTSELSLAPTPRLSPFRQSISKEEVARIRERKLAQLPKLREMMREVLVASAASLDMVPPEEQIVVGVSLFHYSWEDTRGIPEQVVMQAKKGILADYQARRIPKDALEASIRVEEY